MRTTAICLGLGLLGPALVGAGTAGTDAAESKAILLRPARVFDAVSGEAHEGWAVLVSGRTIA
ncbi:MAG: hypothetical protein LJF15_15685, partial [Acidobacteria bacterium]|nr:hypothetical protein [Acidobacteriota bacterium]